MIQKNVLKWMQYFRILSKNCGALRYKGREYNINAVTKRGYIVQDVFRREAPFMIQSDDAEITDLKLMPEFTGFFSKQAVPVVA